MKLFIRIALSMCVAAVLATPANAYWPFSFGGWWGAGYYGSPAYSAPMYSSYYGSPSYTSYYGSPSYTSFYGSYSSPSYGYGGYSAPVHSASYGSYSSCDGGCCTNSCCQSSCGDPCGSGCASGSCGGVTPAGTLKPAQDPISDKKAPVYEEDPRPRQFNPDSRTPRSPAANDALDPVDEREKDRLDPFIRPPAGDSGRTNSGTGSGRDPRMFDDTIDPALERSNQKPPMSDPLEGEQVEPVESELGNPSDEKTFYDENLKPDNTTSRGRDAVVARASSLSEVIAPKRLASRSLPSSHPSASRSTLADKSNAAKPGSSRPLRWISAPLADGHVQL